MTVSENDVVNMTNWAFFTQADRAPRDYAQARPGTGIDNPERERARGRVWFRRLGCDQIR